MKDDFAKALPRILVYEGGKVDDPEDPGGRTNKGITQATFNAFLRSHDAATRDVYGITDAEVSTIYKGEYWDRVRGDELPVGVDLCVFDAAVNSGVGRAIKWLQQSLGDHYSGQVDGVLGNKTLQAIEDLGDADTLIEEFCARRLGALKRLSTFKRFGKGWTARIANVQKTACAWNDTAPEPDAVDVSGLGFNGNKKAPVDGNLKDPPISAIATHVTTAATSVGAVAAQATTGLTSVGDTFAWVKYALGGLAVLSVGAGILVKISSDAKDAAEKGTARATVDIDADHGLEPEPALVKAA